MSKAKENSSQNAANGSAFNSMQVQSRQPLRDSINHALEQYFAQLDGQAVTHVYDMVLAEVELPLLQAVMKHTDFNQSRASEVLGLNRGTLRKKLKQYNINQD